MPRRDRLSDAELDRRLRALDVEFPKAPHLDQAVLANLRQPKRRFPWRVAIVLALLAALLASTSVIAGAFGIGPVRILFEGSMATPNGVARSIRSTLGRRVDIKTAQSVVGFPLEIPRSLGMPDETYVLPTGIVSFIYHAREGLPAIDNSDIGLLMMIIAGDTDPDLIGKIVHEGQTTLEAVSIGGRPGYWITGEPHVLWYRMPDGRESQVQSRLVTDSLLWQGVGVVYRMESAAGEQRTIELASGLEPVP
jgi:hypothetical protein